MRGRGKEGKCEGGVKGRGEAEGRERGRGRGRGEREWQRDTGAIVVSVEDKHRPCRELWPAAKSLRCHFIDVPSADNGYQYTCVS